MAELADALDLGSSGTPVQVQVLSPAPTKIAQPLWLCFFVYKGGGLEVGAVVNNNLYGYIIYILLNCIV